MSRFSHHSYEKKNHFAAAHKLSNIMSVFKIYRHKLEVDSVKIRTCINTESTVYDSLKFLLHSKKKTIVEHFSRPRVNHWNIWKHMKNSMFLKIILLKVAFHVVMKETIKKIETKNMFIFPTYEQIKTLESETLNLDNHI